MLEQIRHEAQSSRQDEALQAIEGVASVAKEVATDATMRGFWTQVYLKARTARIPE